MPELILASTSPYRRELLTRLGIPFRCEAPVCDEEAIKKEGHAPRELAERLAALKAQSLAGKHPGAILIGSDQLASGPAGILGKPGTRAAALAQLEALSGRTHELITALAVWRDGRLWMHTDVARLTMRALTRAELERYVDADRPFDCAGSYRLEARGIALFERIDAEDHSAIVGLPLMALAGQLRTLGLEVP